MSEKMGFQVHGNWFEGNFRSVRKFFKKKKKPRPPSQSELLGKWNLKHKPLKSKNRFFNAFAPRSSNPLKSQVKVFRYHG